jgi:hypothetical protein
MNAGGEPCPAHLSEARCAAGICLPGLRARLLRPAGIGHLGVRGTSRRASRYGPESRAGSGRWSSTSRSGGSPSLASDRPLTSAGPYPAEPGAGRPACHPSWAVSRGARRRPPGLPPQLGRIPRCPAPAARPPAPPNPGPGPEPRARASRSAGSGACPGARAPACCLAGTGPRNRRPAARSLAA